MKWLEFELLQQLRKIGYKTFGEEALVLFSTEVCAGGQVIHFA